MVIEIPWTRFLSGSLVTLSSNHNFGSHSEWVERSSLILARMPSLYVFFVKKVKDVDKKNISTKNIQMVSKFTYNKHLGLTRLSMNYCTFFFFCYPPSSRSISRESLYIKGTFFANKVLLNFDNNVVLWLGTDLLTLE
jgi:hypothetical protein